MAEGFRQGRSGAAATLLGAPEDDIAADQARTIGSVQVALMSGIVMQALADPAGAPTGADVLAGIRAIAKITD